METCQTCSLGIPDDEQFQTAITKANEQSKQNKEPVAIYKEGSEYKLLNAFQAYAAGYPVCKVVSAYHGNTS